MTAFLSIVGVIGLIIFVVGAILWFVGPAPRRPSFWQIAVVGLIIWAIAAIISSLMVMF